jgi:aspartate/methionine/tyrosine aminotransferase
MKINTYTIQEWLFSEAAGKFDIDLAESGIQYHYSHDLNLEKNYDLNYSSDCGNQDLRNIIANLYGVTNKNIAITHGSQEGLYLFYRSFLQRNDHVITFSPGWQQSWEVPKTTGADVSVLKLKAENNYQLDFDNLTDNIRADTKLIILTNPGNPTGVTFADRDIEKLIALCRKNHIFILADEEYFTDYGNSLVKRYEKSAITSSLSKIYGFPGLRIGWFIGPEEMVKEVINYKRYVTVSNSSLCEYLACEVLNSYQTHLEHYQTLCQQGLDYFKKWLNSYPELTLVPTQGTPFAYCKLNMSLSSFEFCKQLLAKYRVLIMPGEVFEDKQTLRITFGRHHDTLAEGLKAIGSFISSVREMKQVAS